MGRYDPLKVKRAFESLSHRGPDDSRLIMRKEGAWGVHRLAISSVGEAMEQPFEDEGGILLFNGEIYNVHSLAITLGLKEYSESRVLLRAWQRWGVEFVKKLRGMYAIAIFRLRDQKLFLFRDPSGKKPLFYRADEDCFAFASEAKALYALKPFIFERRRLIQYLGYQSTIAPNTLDYTVCKMEAGECIEIAFDNMEAQSTKKVQRAYTLKRQVYDPWLETPQLYYDEVLAARAVEEALSEAVELRIPKRVDWGVLLSGGLDSSLVAAMAHKSNSKRIRTFSVGFLGYDKFDESLWAKQTARHLGADYKSYNFTKKEFFETLEILVPLLDEPLGDPAIVPLFFLMRQAADEGIKVLLGGEGSDELFLGYRTYPEYFAIEKARKLPYRNWLRRYFRAHYSENKEWEWFKRAWEDKPIFRSTAELYTDLQLNRLLRQNVRDGENLEAIYPYLKRFEASKRTHPADWYSYLDLKVLLGEVYLVKQDRVSMAAGIEARSPFLDHRVIESAFAIDGQLRIDSAPKGIVKGIAQKYLPASIVNRRKKGLNYPFIEWILEDGGLETIQRVQNRYKLFQEDRLTFLAKGANRGKFRQHLFPIYILARWLEHFMP